MARRGREVTEDFEAIAADPSSVACEARTLRALDSREYGPFELKRLVLREATDEDLHLFDRWFRLNGDFNTRDEIGVRKTFGGLAKLLFPSGEMGRDDAEAMLCYAVEGRRRVKEQLKTMAGVEFIDVNLGYIDV